jgi:hypothetical protein
MESPDTPEPSDRIKDVAGFIDIRDILSSFLQGAPALQPQEHWPGHVHMPATVLTVQKGKQACSLRMTWRYQPATVAYLRQLLAWVQPHYTQVRCAH